LQAKEVIEDKRQEDDQSLKKDYKVWPQGSCLNHREYRDHGLGPG
jgi:hypothetical protein